MKPREMAAKFPGRCALCQGPVAVGDKIKWFGRGVVKHAAIEACEAVAAVAKQADELAEAAGAYFAAKPRNPEPPAWWADMQCPDGCCGPGADFWPDSQADDADYWWNPVPPDQRGEPFPFKDMGDQTWKRVYA